MPKARSPKGPYAYTPAFYRGHPEAALVDTHPCFIDDGPPTRDEVLGRAVSTLCLAALALPVFLPALALSTLRSLIHEWRTL